MFSYLSDVRRAIREHKSTLKCGNGTVGIADNRTAMKEKFRNVSWHAEEGDNDKEVDRHRGQKTKSVHSNNRCT